MRIAFLFEPAANPLDCFNTISQTWLRGLAESQHQVKVITRRDTAKKFPLPHANVEWTEPMRSWGLWEFPQLFSLLLAYAPQVVHLSVGRPISRTGLWPALSVLKSLGIPLVISPGDHCAWPPAWRFHDQLIAPPYTADWAVPLLLPQNFSAASDMAANRVFVPGPLYAHSDWRQTLNKLMSFIAQNPEKTFDLAWDWSEIPIAERLSWRTRWQSQTLGAQLNYLGPLSLHDQLTHARASGHVMSEFLRDPSWAKACFDQLKIAATTPLPMDTAINQLSRSYRALL
ncbi:MAG: glycosyltransferase family 4 protein [Bdellovibrionales bacterium]